MCSRTIGLIITLALGVLAAPLLANAQSAKSGDLSIERPQHFDLVINLRTVEALGLTIPPTILYQATKVIR